MVYNGVLDINFKTNSSTYYTINDKDKIQDYIDMFKSTGFEVKYDKIPDDLFGDIVSHDKIKSIATKAIHAKHPVHLLMVGPPATAKSMFLADIAKLPQSKYILGSTTSKAGMVDYLLEAHPRYLVIDELEKTTGSDFATLLSLMATGVVTRLKHGMNETTQMETWVIAGANNTKNIPQELLSRFFIYNLTEYNKYDFTQISNTLLEKEEVTDEKLKGFIIESVYNKTKDVRDIIKLARLCNNVNEVMDFYY